MIFVCFIFFFCYWPMDGCLAEQTDIDNKTMTLLSESVADLSLHLLKEVSKPDKNCFFSPLSIAVALAMTYTGADGETKKEMKATLFPYIPDEEVHRGFGQVMFILNKGSENYQLHSANRLYAQNGLNILPEFSNTLSTQYQSEMIQVDFKNEAAKIGPEINSWVEKETNNKIKDLIPPGVLDAMTRLVLVNAIYFKGDWQAKFKASDTEAKPFYSAPNKERQVDAMHRTGDYLYYEEDDVQVLGMPYKGNELAMFVLLPKQKYGLTDFEQKLTAQRMLQLISSAKKTKVVVQVPKFKLEKSFSLNDALQKLGIQTAFGQSADFSKITGKKDLHISAVLHKAFVDERWLLWHARNVLERTVAWGTPKAVYVNEEGSEAAAATGELIRAKLAVSPAPPRPKVFTADHPFTFTIVYNANRSPLFIGRYA